MIVRSVAVLVVSAIVSMVACGAQVDTQIHDGVCRETWKEGCTKGDTCTSTEVGCGGVPKQLHCECRDTTYSTGWDCGGGGNDAGCPQGINDCTTPPMTGQPCAGPGMCPGAAGACPTTCDCDGKVWKCSEQLCMDAGADG